MNKQQMLNGMSEEEFYNLYPTEEDYVMAMGGQAGNDDFYVPHQDADRLRASTPINFVNTPYYNLGGASDGPLGYFGDGGGKKKRGAKYVEPVNPNYVADSMATVNYAALHPELFDPNVVQFGLTPNAKVQKFPMKNGVQGRPQIIASKSVPTAEKNVYQTVITDPKYSGAQNEKALKWSMNELQKTQVGEGRPQPFPYLFGVSPQQQQYGGQHMMPDGTMMNDSDMDMGGSPFNYGAFPAMRGGGEFTMIINDLLQKQFGGVDNQAPSTDSVIDDKKNFFNSYIRNNVGKVLAEEMKNEFQQQMMAGAYMQNGGPFSNSYTGVTGSNEELTYQMQNGGPAMDRADVNARTTECSPMEKMDPNSQCYDRQFAMSQMNFTKTPDFGGYNFMADVEGDKTGAPYEAQQTPYSKENSQGQSLNNTENNPLNMGDNTASQQEAYNATKTKGPGFNWQQFMPNGIDQANKILGTMDFVTNRLDARENKKWEKENAWRYSGDAVLEAKPQTSSSRGDYSLNSGKFRSDQYVPVQFPGTNYGNVGTNQYAQYGGSGFNEGDDVYMSDEEIQQYLAAGGEIEILD